MTKKMRIEITVTRVYEAEFTDTIAASAMFKTLERDPNPTTLEGMSGEGWSIRSCGSAKKSVEPVREDTVLT